MIEEIFSTAIEAIAKAKERIDGLEEELSALTSEVNSFEGEYAKEIKTLQDLIDNQTLLIDRIIREAIAKIPTPSNGVDGKDGADGKDAVVDYNYIISQIPAPKDGIDGTKGDRGLQGLKGDKGDSAEVDYQVLKDFILSNIPKPIKGDKGDSGQEGVGIKSVDEALGDIVITMTDDKVYRFKLPHIRSFTTQSGGTGGGTTDLTPLEFETLFKSSLSTSYKELTYDVDGNITTINVWENNTKSTPLYIKTLTYTTGSITQISIQDLIANKTMTTNISYNTGNITSISNQII